MRRGGGEFYSSAGDTVSVFVISVFSFGQGPDVLAIPRSCKIETKIKKNRQTKMQKEKKKQQTKKNKKTPPQKEKEKKKTKNQTKKKRSKKSNQIKNRPKTK